MGIARVGYHGLLFAQFAYFLYAFGSTHITDALIIAQTLPFLLSSLFNRGFTHILIPLFTEFREQKGEEKAWKFASALLFFSLLALIGLMLLIVILAPFLIRLLAPGFSPEDQALGTRLLRYLSVFVILNGIIGIPRCLYFAYHSFTVPAVTSLFLSTSVIVAIFLFKDLLGIYAVVLGTLVGGAMQLFVLFGFLNVGKRKFRWFFHLQAEGIGEFTRLLGPRLVLMVITRFNVVVDRGFASGLGPAFVSALSYADRICTAPLEFLNATFGVVIMPVLSGDVALGNMEEFKERLGQYVRLASFFIVPVTIFFLLSGGPIIQLLFQGGAYGIQGVSLTTAALIFYSLGLVPVSISTTLRGGFFALKDTVTPLKVGIWGFFCNFLLNY
ncbi:MAG: hypothetical protein D6736_01875, partial [Nitrospinota bacterium]